MCTVAKPKAPKPAPIQAPTPILEQVAPDATSSKRRKNDADSVGTKRYRGSALNIPTVTASPSSLNVPGA